MINEDALKSLERLHQLKNDGIITDEDFEKAKGKLLDGGSSQYRPLRNPVAPQSNGDVVRTHGLFEKFDGTLPPENNGVAWMLLPLRRYADFTGRSRRKEFWMFQLISSGLVLLAFLILTSSTRSYGGPGAFEAILILLIGMALLAMLVPSVAVQVRRFHDQDKPGALALLNLIPYLGSLVVLVFMFIEGTPGDNQYGPDPIEHP